MTTSARTEPRPLAPPDQPHRLPSPELRKALRVICGYSQEEFAAELGVTDGSVSAWERNPSGPGRRNLGPYLRILLRCAAAAREMGLPIAWPAAQTSDTRQPQK